MTKMESSCLESLSIFRLIPQRGWNFLTSVIRKLTLSIPNCLLHHWHSWCPCCTDKDKKFTNFVNSRIKGAAVQFIHNERLNERLRGQAAKLHYKVQQLSGRRRLQYLLLVRVGGWMWKFYSCTVYLPRFMNRKNWTKFYKKWLKQ